MGSEMCIRDRYETGNQMAVSHEEYIETIEWPSEEHQNDVGDENARIPIDKPGAEVMYVINPREVKYAPLTLLAAAKIFYAAGENWTMPSEGWDNTNFGLFAGDGGRSGEFLAPHAVAVRIITGGWLAHEGEQCKSHLYRCVRSSPREVGGWSDLTMGFATARKGRTSGLCSVAGYGAIGLYSGSRGFRRAGLPGAALGADAATCPLDIVSDA